MPSAPIRLLVLKLCFAGSLAANAQGMSAETKAWCERVVPLLRQALTVDPTARAAQAAQAGDMKYLQWYGVVSAVPGIKSQTCVQEARLSKPFEGTSDALCSEEHRVLYERTHSYAEAFNRQMAIERKKRKLRTCDDAYPLAQADPLRQAL